MIGIYKSRTEDGFGLLRPTYTFSFFSHRFGSCMGSGNLNPKTVAEHSCQHWRRNSCPGKNGSCNPTSSITVCSSRPICRLEVALGTTGANDSFTARKNFKQIHMSGIFGLCVVRLGFFCLKSCCYSLTWYSPRQALCLLGCVLLRCARCAA